MPHPPTKRHLRQDLVQSATDEFTSLITLEGSLLAHWNRAQQDEGERRSELPNVETLRWQAEECRDRRKNLMENFAIPEEEVRKGERVVRRWELAVSAVVAAAEEEGEEEQEEGGLIEVDAGTDIIPNDDLVRSAKWWSSMSTPSSWLMKGLGLLSLLFALVAVLQYSRHPVLLTVSSNAINFSSHPTNMTALISIRLASAEKHLASCVSATETFPHALEACTSAQTHVGKVRELWVDSGIFEEALALDLRTTAKLVEVASEETSWMPCAWLGLDLAAYYGVVPASWTNGCVAARMAEVLQAHAVEEEAWKRRLTQAVAKGRGHVAAAQRQVQLAQTVWLPIEAKQVVTPQMIRVSKAWQGTVVLCGRLGVVEQLVGEYFEAADLGSMWEGKDNVGGGGGGDREGENEGKEESDMVMAVKMHSELLSHSSDSLRRWAEGLRAAAECRSFGGAAC